MDPNAHGNDGHCFDEQLIRVLDHEADAVEAAWVRDHLAACPDCRQRSRVLEEASAAYMAVHSPSAGKTSAPRRLRAWLYAAAVILVMLLPALWMRVNQRPEAGLPDPALTPGRTKLISQKEVCAVPPDSDERGAPEKLAHSVFDRYRIASPRPGAYEVDYLISPALGGAEDVANLWPQPYASGEWNSRVKDALEDALRREVCAGQLDLAAAQSEIAANWIEAYRRHFRVSRPLAQHASFVKDRSWP